MSDNDLIAQDAPVEEKPKKPARSRRKPAAEQPAEAGAATVEALADPIPVAEPIVAEPIPVTVEAPIPVQTPVEVDPPSATFTAAPVVQQPALDAGFEPTPIPVPNEQRQFDRPRRDRPRDVRPDRQRHDRGDRDHQQNGRERHQGHPRDGQRVRPQGAGDRVVQAPIVQAQPRNGNIPNVNVAELENKPVEELYELAKQFELQGYSRMKRPDLISKLLQARTEMEGNIFGDGVLEIIEDGFGFLRGPRFLPGSDDIYVSQSQIRRFGLRTGDRVSGQVRPPKDNEKFFSLLRVEAVNGVDPETARRRPSFDTLTPIFPLELINLETQPNILSTRLLNLVAPIGRGQRGLIVSPPKAGKTLAAQSDRQRDHHQLSRYAPDGLSHR